MRLARTAAFAVVLAATPLSASAQGHPPVQDAMADHVRADDLDLVSGNGDRLGEVEHVVLDGQGRLAGYIVEMERGGRDDRDVFVPLEAVRLERTARGRAVLRTDRPIEQFRDAPRGLR